MADVNHSATLSIGARVSGSWKQSVGAVASGTDKIKKEISSLKDAQRRVTQEIKETERASKSLGIDGSADVAKLTREHERLGRVLDSERDKLKRVAAFGKLDVGGRTSGALKQLGANLAEVGRYAVYAGAALGATAAAGIGWFTKSALEATSSMETLQTALSTVTGGDANAKAALGWITTFAAETPYELGQVGAAFQRLKAYGIDPTDGTLKTLGDTASSMGKDLMSAVEAMADAVTGENERLKEFGIRATKAGDKISYFYKNAAGDDVVKTVNKNSQKMIAATLSAIWNDKYAGSMAKQSRTWAGLVSNLSDQWTQFQVRVMQGGVFDVLKGELEGLLANVNKWANDGTLERWADEIASAYKWAFGQVREGFTWVRDHWPEIKTSFLEGVAVAKDLATTLYRVGKWASDAVGGTGNLAKGLLVLGAVKTLAPLGSLVSVGWGIVSWLSTATGLTAALSTGLTAAAARMTVLAATGAGMGIMAGLGVGAAGAAGYAVGTGINALSRNEAGKTWSDRLGEWASSDVDVKRAQLNGMGSMQSSRVSNSGGGKTITNAPVINMSIDARGADAQEVADRVSEKLNQSMRAEELSSYGG